MIRLQIVFAIISVCSTGCVSSPLSDRKPTGRSLSVAAIRQGVPDQDWQNLIESASRSLESRTQYRLKNAGSVEVTNPPDIFAILDYAAKAGLKDPDICFVVRSGKCEEKPGRLGRAILGGREGELWEIPYQHGSQVLLHELGHMLGLDHSPNRQYLMHGSALRGVYLTKDYASRIEALFQGKPAQCPKQLMACGDEEYP